MPSENELAAARCQGRHVAQVALKLVSLTRPPIEIAAGPGPGHPRGAAVPTPSASLAPGAVRKRITCTSE
jgi:hypothetical protein